MFWGVSDRFVTPRNSIDGGDDVHSLTIAFQGCYALATDTPPPLVAAILWSETPGH
jgi:hypothetical protein